MNVWVNGDAHLHWHLFPRVSGDLDGYGNNGREPVWWYPREKMYSDDNRPNDEELEIMKQTLCKELETLLSVSKSQKHRYALVRSDTNHLSYE